MLRFLLDEHYRGVFLQAVLTHNLKSPWVIDAVAVGDPVDLPRRSIDPVVLHWAEQHGRILVSRDRRTMPGHFAQHLRAGHHSPGVLMVRRRASFTAVIAELAIITHAGNPADYADQGIFVIRATVMNPYILLSAETGHRQEFLADLVERIAAESERCLSELE